MSEKMKAQQNEAREKAVLHPKTHVAKKNPEPEPAVKTRNGTPSKTTDNTPSGTPDTGPKKRGRGRPRKDAAKEKPISNYFEKADVEITDNNPTVQQALEQAAGEYEANPTALGGQSLVATDQPSLVTGGKMRTYQLEGLEWLKTLWMNGLCGILADEMGLGKTIQAISMIAFMKENNVPGPYLIVAPLSTVSNWVAEFKRWAPAINVVLYHAHKNDRVGIRDQKMQLDDQETPDFPVVCTSYEICMSDRKYLASYKWRYIIVVSL